jgi:antitoxin CptB
MHKAEIYQSKRLLWRCRRGLLELDIMLGKFVAQQYQELNQIQMQALDDLLSMPDNQFLDLLLQRESTKERHIEQLLQVIRKAQQ